MVLDFKRTDEVLVDIQGVSLTLGNKLILRDVNATVKDIHRDGMQQGQVICFLGPSGTGKTQLSRCIAGLQTPNAGQVLIRREGREGGYGLLPTHAGEVCVVPQNYPLFEYASVATNLFIAGKQGGLKPADINIKASTFIEAFGLGEHLSKYPKELSGGTRQRVAIARQLMCATHFMVMDEPFSGLDPIMKRAAMDAIVKLSLMDTYNTIIVVTHDVTEGLSIADTVWLMGLERTLEAPKSIYEKVPGATIVEQIDLAEMGLAWRPDIQHDKEFLGLVGRVKDRFQTLK